MLDPKPIIPINNKRIPSQQVVDAAPIIIDENDPDLLFLRRSKVITTKGGKVDYSQFLGISPAVLDLPEPPADPEDPGPGTGGGIVDLDVPQLADIESVSYEQYFDSITKSIKVKAIITVKNSSYRESDVKAVDARIFDASAYTNTAQQAPVTAPEQSYSTFVAPSPSSPFVVFSRSGTAIAWGWNNVTGLNSYQSVSYEWKISTTDSPSANAIDSGTETYSSVENKKIGTIANSRAYRVSSLDGDTPATSSSRWLRARAVVVGTDGNTYNSEWSTPL